MKTVHEAASSVPLLFLVLLERKSKENCSRPIPPTALPTIYDLIAIRSKTNLALHQQKMSPELPEQFPLDFHNFSRGYLLEDCSEDTRLSFCGLCVTLCKEI